MRFAFLCFTLVACASNMQAGDDDGGGGSVLGFTASTSLSTMLDEVIPWVTQAVKDGRL